MNTPSLGSYKNHGFLKPEPVQHEVAGQVENFYPVSLNFVLRLNVLSGPLAKILSVVFGQPGTAEKKDTIYRTTSDDGHQGTEHIDAAVRYDLASMQYDRVEEAAQSALDAITDPQSVDAIYELIMDSMKDVFHPDEVRNKAAVQAFRDALPVAHLPGLIEGAFKANAGIFAPLTAGLVERVRGQAEKIRKASLSSTKSSDGPSASSPPSEEPSPSTNSAG